MSRAARPIVAAVLLVGVLAVGGLALASTRKGKGGTGQPLTLPTKADPKLGTVSVGAATGYAGSVLIDTGAVNYDYMRPGWAYAGVKKDW